MPKFPDPPGVAALRALGADRARLAAGAQLFRIYFRAGNHPTTWNAFRTWGPTSGRFDPHEPPPHNQSRAVMYAAEHGLTCFAEVYQDTRTIERDRGQPALVALELEREIALLDLTDTWPTKAGASMAIASGPRPRARAWAREIYEAFPDLDGVLYPSSMNANQPSVALFDRARDAVPAQPSFHRQLSDPAILSVVRGAAYDLNYDLT